MWRGVVDAVVVQAFNLVGSIHTYKPVITLGDVAENHGEEVGELARDLGKSVTKAMVSQSVRTSLPPACLPGRLAGLSVTNPPSLR